MPATRIQVFRDSAVSEVATSGPSTPRRSSTRTNIKTSSYIDAGTSKGISTRRSVQVSLVGSVILAINASLTNMFNLDVIAA